MGDGQTRVSGLRYVSDGQPGIRRLRNGKGFRYLLPNGSPVRDTDELARIRSLAVPPAWRGVWICPRPDGHVQATGLDARGRKQYRYHPDWRAARDEAKYNHLFEFGQALPGLRARVDADLGQPGMPRERVLAALVRLLDVTLIRVGNEEYVKANGSYGLTTLRSRHATAEGTALRFRFLGKSGVRHDVTLRDRRLAALIRRCQELPGQELFQYLQDGEPRPIGSVDVNEYLRDASGVGATAKDFRTWGGSVMALRALRSAEPCSCPTKGKWTVAEVIKEVARGLRNTPAVCRKCYVHPAVVEAYLGGAAWPKAAASDWLTADEEALLALLKAAR